MQGNGKKDGKCCGNCSGKTSCSDSHGEKKY